MWVLGQGVVVGVADGPDRGVDALFDQALGERDRDESARLSAVRVEGYLPA
jgi:hypothetical protein